MPHRMRSFVTVAVLAVLAASMALPTAASAGGRRPALLRPLHLLHAHVPSLRALRAPASRALLRSLDVPAARTTSPAALVTDPKTLSIQWPANATNVQSGVVDATYADDPNQNPFIAFHDPAHNYASAGMQTGLAQFATLPLGTTSDVIEGAWLASVYPTTTQAATFVTDTVAYLTSGSGGLTDTSCGSTCHSFAIGPVTVSGKTYAIFYLVVSVQNVVAELDYLVGTDLLTTDKDALAAATDAVGTSANQVLNVAAGTTGTTPTATPSTAGPPGVSIEVVALGHKVKKKLKSTKTLKSGEKGTFLVQVQFQNPGTNTESATISFVLKGKVIGTLDMQNAGQQSDGSVIFDAVQGFKTTKKEKLTAKVKVSLGTAQASGKFTFTVKKK